MNIEELKVKVMIMTGYQDDMYGNRLISKNIWEEMTTELLEKLKRRGAGKVLAKNVYFDMNTNEAIEVNSTTLPIYDQYFVIDLENNMAIPKMVRKKTNKNSKSKNRAKI